MSGKGKPEDSRPLRLQEVQLLSQVGQALNAAQTDSYEVWEARHAWQHFQHQSTSLMEALERWRQSFPEIQQLDMTRLLPNLEAVGSELDLRFEQIGRMLAGSAPDRTPQPITLAVDHTELRALTHFQGAAVALTATQLESLEALSRSFFDCVRDLRGYGGPAAKPLQENRRSGRVFDPDRLQGAVTVMATLWIGFLIWVYVNPPGHAGFAEMATIFTMVAVRTGGSPTGIALSFILGTLFGGIPYVFVMPHLSGYGQLGLMIFGVTFGISYLFWKPRLHMSKTPLLAMFLSAISPQNEQTYSFASYANTLTMMILAGALIVATAYIPRSPSPEKVFLRLLARFFRYAEFVMARLALDWEQNKGLAGRWRTALYRHDLLELPEKLAGWGERIDYRLLPGTTREQVQALVTSLRALAFRIKELVEARTYPQADLLVREVIDDVRDWRSLAQEQFRLWTDDPGRELEPGVDVGDRLIARLARMEARLNETFRLTGDGELGAEDRENFYRLLGSYRGFAEDVIGYARLARGIDWVPWQEARF
jgi:hypothetical protein